MAFQQKNTNIVTADAPMPGEVDRNMLYKDDLLSYTIVNLTQDKVLVYSVMNNNLTAFTDMTFAEICNIIAEHVLEESAKTKFLQLHARENLLQQYAQGEHHFVREYHCRLNDGKILWLKSVLYLSEDENKDIILREYCYDINKQKTIDIMMEFAVNDEYDLLGAVNYGDNSSVMMYGPKAYNYYNKLVVEEDYTVSLERFAANAVHEEDREMYLDKVAISNIRKALSKEKALEVYFRTIHEGKLCHKRVRYINYGTGNTMCLFIQNDMTEFWEEERAKQENLKAALAMAEDANRSKTTFLSNMSHDIRTPMNAIIGFAELGLETNCVEEMHEALHKIRSASEYLLGLINDVLDMSRIEVGNMLLNLEPCRYDDIFPNVREIMVGKAALKGIALSFIEENVNKKYLLVDKQRLRQILVNLLNNAIKFTPTGGEIICHTIVRPKAEDSCELEISISDTGIGMSEEFIANGLYKAFEQEKMENSMNESGTGLGLAIVKQLVDKMQGSITCMSKQGEGTTFVVKVLCKNAEQTTLQEEKALDYSLLANHKILLCEDQPLNVEIVRKLLTKYGVKVEVVGNGVFCLDVFQKSAEGEFDAILMDIRMPHMNGLEATKAIRALTRPDAKTIPIIAMTANAFADDVEMAKEAGMNAYLTKPINSKLLYSTLLDTFKV